VVGIDAFLNDFDRYFATLFDGVRHDSGCPFEWANKMIKHYEKMGIDAKTKTLVFSDGLDIPLALELLTEFHDKTNLLFGIGTNLTNDVGIKPLSIVMKMIECNGQPVAKISDSPGKTMCEDEAYLDYLKKIFEIN
jgi:nicotinate phosphoribosyltransferase